MDLIEYRCELLTLSLTFHSLTDWLHNLILSVVFYFKLGKFNAMLEPVQDKRDSG